MEVGADDEEEQYEEPIVYRDDLNYGMYNPLYIPPRIREAREKKERERKRRLGIEVVSDEDDVWRRH